MIVGALHLVPFIKQRRIKDKIHILSDQPGHMTVRQLCGITLGFAGDGFYAKLVYFSVGAGGQDDPVAQSGKKGMPEGIIFVHI